MSRYDAFQAAAKRRVAVPEATDGMREAWALATGEDHNADDGLTVAADGDTRLQHYVKWLAGLRPGSEGTRSARSVLPHRKRPQLARGSRSLFAQCAGSRKACS